RAERIAVSDGRPSRRKKDPGILPAAYMRSSTSTVSGKKSMPSRTPGAAFAVASTTVSPIWATTAPWDCWARRPVSSDRVSEVPLRGVDTLVAASGLVLVSVVLAAMWHAPFAARVLRGWSGGGASSQSASPAAGGALGTGGPRLAADLR